MAKFNLSKTMSRKLNRAGLKMKKYSPELLVGAGIIGIIASTVMACKASTKINAMLDEAKDRLDTIHSIEEKPEIKPEDYKVEETNKYITSVYISTGWDLFKLYAPAITLGSISIAAILGGHRILSKRNAALAAAYATVDKCFKDYRGRIVDKFGKELDREMRYGIKTAEIEEKVVDEKGKEKTVKKTVEVVDPSITMPSDYSKFFDCGCEGWTKDPEKNLMFLKDQQRYMNDLLQTRGHLFLNEVYDALGIQRTQAGNIVGWIYDEKNPIGDNVVDFGIYDLMDERKRAFVNGYERTILLDFNVDGDILDYL